MLVNDPVTFDYFLHATNTCTTTVLQWKHYRYSAANKFYFSAGHHEQKNKRATGQIIFSMVTLKTKNKTSLTTFSKGPETRIHFFKIFVTLNEKHYFNNISTCSMKLFKWLLAHFFIYVCLLLKTKEIPQFQ